MIANLLLLFLFCLTKSKHPMLDILHDFLSHHDILSVFWVLKVICKQICIKILTWNVMVSESKI